MALAVDPDEHLVEVPAPLAKPPHPIHPLARMSAANSGPNRFHHSRTVS